MTPMTQKLELRARRIRSQAAVRAWEYRQRHFSHGLRFRLRLLLAQASEAYALEGAEAQRLLNEGARAETVGLEVEPPKTILFVDRERLGSIEGKRALPMLLSSQLLDAECLALVRW
jgi:hypothetical protein